MPPFDKKIKKLSKPLKSFKVLPKYLCTVENNTIKRVGDYSPITLNAGESAIVEFPDHMVGYIHFSVKSLGNIADSPTVLEFIPGEYQCEITTPQEDYLKSKNHALSSGWLQREEKTCVFLPASCKCERRFAFTYLKITRLDSASFPILLDELYCERVSSVDYNDLKPLNVNNKRLESIYDFCAKSLMDCEMDVFEDAPKRDRRLWLSEFRLHALADSVTFNNKDLVKKCIYYFANYRIENKIVAPCVFPDSPPYVDSNWYFTSFALGFITLLSDYVEIYNDKKLLNDLYSVAIYQIDVGEEWFNNLGHNKRGGFWIDWSDGLDVSCAQYGVYIYDLKNALKLAKIKKDKVNIQRINDIIEKRTKELLKYYDSKKGIFISDSKQISYASQIWGVLAEVLTKEQNVKVLENVEKIKDAKKMNTPHTHGYFLEALCKNGLYERALSFIEEVWGNLIDLGETRCPEYLPTNTVASKYRTPVMDSACHGSGAIPCYYIKKYLLNYIKPDKD